MTERAWEDLIDLGVFTPYIDTDGEMTYNVNLGNAYMYARELYMAEVDDNQLALLAAVDLGYIEMDFKIDEAGSFQVGYIVVE